jgi:plastocyanin
MRPVVALLFVAACGGGSDGGDDTPPVDSPAAASIAETACGGEVETINSLGTRFDPMSVTISMGEVVAFDNGEVADDHDIVPNTANATGLEVGRGETKCFRFTDTGTFGFRCGIHGFVGTVVVE